MCVSSCFAIFRHPNRREFGSQSLGPKVSVSHPPSKSGIRPQALPQHGKPHEIPRKCRYGSNGPCHRIGQPKPGPIPKVLWPRSGAIRPTRDPALPQHGKPREIPSKCPIAVRPSCPGMAQMALCHRIGQPKPLPASGRDSAQVSITWVFDLELSTLLGESRPGHYLFRTVDS